MFRSFTDRLLGGVCGGLGAQLRLNPWVIRILFAALTVASLGLFAVLYLLLWWLTPQETLIGRRKGGLSIVFVLALTAVTIAFWVGRDVGVFSRPDGSSLLIPLVLLWVSGIFFLRQVRS